MSVSQPVQASGLSGRIPHQKTDSRCAKMILVGDALEQLKTLPGNEGKGIPITVGEARNRRSVWSICPRPYKGAHFAVFPPALVEPCIKAGCPAGGVVLDPFGGSGTTGQVAKSLGRDAILIELNPNYIPLIDARLAI